VQTPSTGAAAALSLHEVDFLRHSTEQRQRVLRGEQLLTDFAFEVAFKPHKLADNPAIIALLAAAGYHPQIRPQKKTTSPYFVFRIKCDS